MRTHLSSFARGAAALAMLLVASCLSGHDDWELLSPGDPQHPLTEELRRALDVTVVAGTASLPSGCSAAEGTCPAEVLSLAIAQGCEFPAWDDESWCETGALFAAKYICVAESLMRVASATDVEVLVINETGGTLLAPPQDAESQVELARQARLFLHGAANLALAGLSDPACTADDLSAPAAASGPASEITQGQHAASFVREAYQLYIEAGAFMRDRASAVSDAQRARMTDAAAAEVAELAPFASRAAAAHATVGGEHGLGALRSVGGGGDFGFFPRPRLSAGAARALSYFRDAAVDPARVADPNVNIDLLVSGLGEGADLSDTCDSVRARVAILGARPELLNADTAAEFYNAVGLSRDAFVDARDYLFHESRAFDRSTGQRLPPQAITAEEDTDDVTLPSGSYPYAGSSCDMPLYAATRNPPVQPHPVFWTALLRYDSTPALLDGFVDTGDGPAWTWWSSTATSLKYPAGFTFGEEVQSPANAFTVVPLSVEEVPPNVNGVSDLGVLSDLAYRAQRTIDRIDALGEPMTPPPEGPTGSVLAVDTLAGFLGDMGHGDIYDPASTALVGRGRACALGTAMDTISIRIDLELPGLNEETPGESLIIVTDHESLDCAVFGHIEGAPCSGDDIDELPMLDWDADEVTAGSLTAQFEVALSAWGSARPAPGVQTAYVLRERAGYSSDQPGGYEPVVGWALPVIGDPPVGEYLYCDYQPISPGLMRVASALIEPSTRYAGDQAVSCAGMRVDDFRIPLENELTEDGNGVESSWRHYLSLAQAAADNADALGEALIDEGLQMDLRAESAVDALEQICGVRINVSPMDSIPTTTPIGMDGCDPGYFLQDADADLCTLDPVAWAVAHATEGLDAAALSRCLGATTNESLEDSFVGVGDAELCLWRMDGSVSSICQQEEAGLHRPCPFLAQVGSMDPCPAGNMPPDAIPIHVPAERLLHLFHVPPAEEMRGQPESPGDLPCAALAQLRADRDGLTTEQAYRFAASSFLTSATFANYARSLRLEAVAGDFTRVYYANSIIASTGSPELSETRWPVAGAPLDWLCPAAVMGGFTPPSWANADDARDGLRTYSGPLFCLQNQGSNMRSNNESEGLVDDSPRRFRAAMNDLLGRAVVAAHVVSGESLRGSRVAYYPPAITCAGVDNVRVSDDLIWEHLGTSASLAYQSSEGTLILDHTADTNDYGDPYPLDDIPAVAQRLSTYPEWTVVDYNATGQVVRNFDEGAGHTPGVRNLPLLIVTLGDEDTVGLRNRDESVARLWGDSGSRLQSFMWRHLNALFSGDPLPTAPHTPLFGFTSGPAGDSGPSTIPFSDLTRFVPRESNDGGPCWHRTSDGGPAFWTRNDARPARNGITVNDILNGIELTCMAAQRTVPDPISFGCDTEMTITNVRQAAASRNELRCLANRVSDAAARSVIRGVPGGVVGDVHDGDGAAFGSGSGEYGSQLAIIRAALLEMQNEERAIAAALRTYADSLEALENTLRAHRIGAEIEDLELASTVASHVTNCLVATAEQISGSGSIEGAIGAGVKMGVVCAGGMFQSIIATRVRDLRGQEGALEIENALLGADQEFVRSAQAIREHAVNVRAAFARIDAAVTELRSLQGRGRTALARALFLSDTPTGAHLGVDPVMRRRHNTLRVRYEDAHARSVRLSYIARLALEQRLGMSLSEMTGDLVTVDAPASWADELCTLSPIDYGSLRDTGNADLPSPDNYAGFYVGDYVRRLEQVFESYSFAYPFQEGTDRVVLSLRDDLKHVTAACEAPVPNLLLHTADISRRAGDGEFGWSVLGCEGTDPCLVTATSGLDLPVASGRHGTAVGTLVQFGETATEDTRYAQTVELERGRYRLAWWAMDLPGAAMGEPLDPADVVRAVDPDTGNPLSVLNDMETPVAVASDGDWTRYDYFFDVEQNDLVTIALLNDPTDPTDRSVVVGGLQLERATGLFERDINEPYYSGMSSEDIAVDFPPGDFYPTAETRLGLMPGCRDDGTVLRRRHFTHHCTMACRDGRTLCREDEQVAQCYYETSFQVDEGSLSRFVAGTATGFASGNYNYRFEGIGINLVGTGLRQCDPGASSCFASGNFSYTLLHQGDRDGGFLVRNAVDQEYRAPLFPGRIQEARALAAERYLTNPLSGSDEALLAPYLRSEFQGRPLAGTLVLRIRDEPGLAWNHLEDIQIVLNYRYWTHQR